MSSVVLERLSKRYGDIVALDDFNLTIEGNGCIGLLGPNGAGKTTLMKLLTNISKPTSGRVLINGTEVLEDPQHALSEVGSLVEQPEFYPYLTARESLDFVCRIRGIHPSDVSDEIERVSMLTAASSFLDRKTGSLSRGMKQRLGIASALIGNPGILILDEPSFGLDPKGMKEIRTLISDIKRQSDHIVILSTHLTFEANELCDRIIIVNHGKMAFDTGMRVSEDAVKIETSSIPLNFKLDGLAVRDWKVEGNAIIVEKGSVSNNELIRYLEGKGVVINFVMPYNNIDDIYLKIVE